LAGLPLRSMASRFLNPSNGYEETVEGVKCRAAAMTESKDEDKLFSDLEGLDDEQIEVGLAAGVWSEQVRPLVQHYLYDVKLKRVEAAVHQLDGMQKATRLEYDLKLKRVEAAVHQLDGMQKATRLEYDLKLKHVEAADHQLDEMPTRLAVEEAIKAKTRATAAFILAGGAMLAAMAAALIGFLALQKYGFQPPWQ
jgi:hypothetical protein